MDGTLQNPRRTSAPRLWVARSIYAVLLGAGIFGLLVDGPARWQGELPALAALAAINVLGQMASHELRASAGRAFDLNLAVMLAAAVIAGPAAGFVVAMVPELVYLARRRRAFWNLGLVANVLSFAAMALAGGAVLGAAGQANVARITAAAVVMLLASYLFARLLLVVTRDGASPVRLLRQEFLAVLPHQGAAVAVGVLSAAAIPFVGIFALLAFAVLVHLPDLVARHLVRAPSVAQLDPDAAATVYRAAIGDELGLCRRDRRRIEQIAALIAHRPDRVGTTANPFALAQDALLVTICLETTSQQPAFSASTPAQVVLAAHHWAQLTARCTPALSHREAMDELLLRSVARDAPTALAAAHRIVEREHTLTTHVAGVPRLHRVPVPRSLRRRYLPTMLARLTA